MGFQEIDQLIIFVCVAVRRIDLQTQIFTSESGHELCGFFQFQNVNDVLLNQRRGGGGQSYGLRITEPFSKPAQPCVIGAEVMPPLADTVSFIDGQQLNVDPIDRSHERVTAQSLGRDVDQFVVPGDHVRNARLLLFRRQRAVDKCRRDISIEQRSHLVRHQRDQGADDDRNSIASDRGQLEAKAFASTGRHDAQRVFARHDRFDHLLLSASKFTQSEIPKPAFGLDRSGGHESLEMGWTEFA